MDKPGVRRGRIGATAAGISLLAAAQAAGATFSKLEVSHAGDRYHAVAEAYLDAAPDQVYAALLDFARLPEVSPDILEAKVLREPDSRTQVVYIESRGCIMIFCRTLRQVQRFTELSPSDIVAVTLPGNGNIKEGSSSWHLVADGQGTRVFWETTLEPDFWVPPLIGPGLVQKLLRKHGETFMNGIEARAARHPAAVITGHTL